VNVVVAVRTVLVCSVVEPEPQEPQHFAVAEPEFIQEPDLDLDPTLNGIQKVKIRGQLSSFWETMLLLTSKRQDFVQIILVKNFAKYCLVSFPEPKLFQSRNRNRNKSFRFHNTVLYVRVRVKLVSSVSTPVVRLNKLATP
jgi:hypothetical protein